MYVCIRKWSCVFLCSCPHLKWRLALRMVQSHDGSHMFNIIHSSPTKREFPKPEGGEENEDIEIVRKSKINSRLNLFVKRNLIYHTLQRIIIKSCDNSILE